MPSLRRIVLLAVAACLAPAALPHAAATGACVRNVVVGTLCVQDDPAQPVTCEQTGALATCDLLGDPCPYLRLCYVCPTGDPCGPPLLDR